jgi:hypothetical protein
LDASGRTNSCWAFQLAIAVARSKAQTHRQSPSHWRDGAWPALLETASANQRAASRSF